MFRKAIIVFVFTLIVTNMAFSQAVSIDAAISNAAREISQSVPNGTRVAVMIISSDFGNVSEYIINELIVSLVNTRVLSVLPRNTVELADIYITGTFTREGTANYRLVINATELASNIIRALYRTSILDDMQLRALIAESEFYQDYTVGERLGIGALNIFGGAGSITRGGRTGWLVTGIQGIGLISVIGGLIYGLLEVPPSQPDPLSPNFITQEDYRAAKDRYEFTTGLRRGLIVAGSAAVGTGIVVGFIIPFFHHRSDNSIAQYNFPFNLDLVSSDSRDINGFKISYSMSF